MPLAASSAFRRDARPVLIVSLAVALLTGVVLGPAGAADGDLDPGFSGDGRVVSDFGFDDRADGVAVQADGRVVVAGTSCGGDFLVARYTTDGSPDGTFDGDGRVCIDVNAGSADRGEEVLVLPDGRLLVAGSSAGDFALVRLNADGALDRSFGFGGRATFDLGGNDELRDAVLGPNGTIVMVGETSAPGCPMAPTTPGQTVGVAIARAFPNGAPDPGFGGDGTVVLADESRVQRGLAVAVQNDGGVIAAGRTSSCTRVAIDSLLLRLTPTGAPGVPFHGSQFDEPGPDTVVDLAVQPDGRLVVAIDTFVGPATLPARDDAFTALRFNVDGSADNSFGVNGVATALFGAGTNATATAVTLQNGKVVVGGSVGGDFALARFDANGTLDPAFSGDGTVVTDFGGDDIVAALAVQPDGKLVAAGRTGTDVALARYGTSTTPTSPTTITSTTAVPSPFTQVCSVLASIRATFNAQPWLRPFLSIIDTVRASLGCS